MARQEIDLTTPQPNGKMGEPTKSAWEKVNSMTQDLYSRGIEVGLYSSRPSASSFSGIEYYSTDTKERYLAQGSSWLVLPSGGTELGYAQRTTPFNTSSPTAVDIPGMSLTYMAGENPCVVEFGATLRIPSGNGLLMLYVDGVQISQIFTDPNGYNTRSRISRVIGKTPGQIVSVKLMALAAPSASFDIFGAETDPIYLRACTS